jgi:hypothetical protein
MSPSGQGTNPLARESAALAATGSLYLWGKVAIPPHDRATLFAKQTALLRVARRAVQGEGEEEPAGRGWMSRHEATVAKDRSGRPQARLMSA